MPPAPAPSRRLEIDWLRGLAVLFMVLWHVVDAWHVPTARDTSAFAVVAFFAGWAAPMFLFFAGVSVPLAAAAQITRGRARAEAVHRLVRRGWQVFLLAHLFRLQSFVLSPGASWSSLFKPDILNVLGLGLVATAAAWGRARSRRAEAGWLLLPAVAVAFVLTPWAREWGWPSLLPPRLEGYIRIANGNAVFSLFPAVAYVLAGAFVGTRLVAPSPVRRGPYGPLAMAGCGLLVLAMLPSYAPLPAPFVAWTRAGLLVALRVGVMLLALALVAHVVSRVRVPARDPMLTFGRASLVIYWVHVEVAYGSVSYALHKSLALPWALAAFGAVTAAMYGLAVWWLRRPAAMPFIQAHLRVPAAEGDPVRIAEPAGGRP